MQKSTTDLLPQAIPPCDTSGEIVDFSGERYYAIRHVDQMPAFFISIVSNVDHWLFVSSTGGLTAGRVSPDTALFPYLPADRIHESLPHTGPCTLLRVSQGEQTWQWEPFNAEHFGRFALSRHLYKSVLGNKLCFEEINHDLGLVFRYSWASSDEFGFVRQCELHNCSHTDYHIDLLDGLQNVLPATAPRFAQTNSSNLVDAYKWTELDAESGLAMFALNASITDRAEPSESLKANVVYCLGLDDPTILLSSNQLQRFRTGQPLSAETHKRGIRGAFFVNKTLTLAAEDSAKWMLVADIEQGQADIVALRQALLVDELLGNKIMAAVATGNDHLARIMARNDGFQVTAEEPVTLHHYANVLFNVLRGGYFYDQYQLPASDFETTVAHFNKALHTRHAAFFASLPATLPYTALHTEVKKQNNPQLTRLCQEYLPITFGRRHGDPSRPWNQFAIRLKDDAGNPLLSYQGNWRDIFQNWEALAFSYPQFVENMIAKFVNASTLDGYNPYRITKEGIDWEVEDPEDPWSYIGYWGDHQIIYLLKLLELSQRFHPQTLSDQLHQPLYAYANVPYRIRPFAALLDNPKATVDYDAQLANSIEKLTASMGADARLLLDANGQVIQVTLLEKLLVPLLAKLCNLVVGGGIWMNTQRPEWNDGNNALVGQGLSMVTLCYLRRYITFLDQLLAKQTGTAILSAEVNQWLTDTAAALSEHQTVLASDQLTAADQYALLTALGQAAEQHRAAAYRSNAITGQVSCPVTAIRQLLANALLAIDLSIEQNQGPDRLYHAYNTIKFSADALKVDTLYPMLEGQVAVLSSGALNTEQAVDVLEALFNSALYRQDQQSFMLYPDRPLPGFLEKNQIPAENVQAIPLLQKLLADDNQDIVLMDVDGHYRFNADFHNAKDLNTALDALSQHYGNAIETARSDIQGLFESVFNHHAFTGRSGTMFGFEGLGCIYWHMVSKLLLAVQECFFNAIDGKAENQTITQLGHYYYRVRQGIGFNKTPAEYGAFPADPYSHTTGHSGAQQPGMTGQVKEEILTRFGELGLHISAGVVHFSPQLLRAQEFGSQPTEFRYLDVQDQWQCIAVPAHSLAFTWCQVPIIYQKQHSLEQPQRPLITITHADGMQESTDSLTLSAAHSAALFERTCMIRQIEVSIPAGTLFTDL